MHRDGTAQRLHRDLTAQATITVEDQTRDGDPHAENGNDFHAHIHFTNHSGGMGEHLPCCILSYQVSFLKGLLWTGYLGDRQTPRYLRGKI